jgi:hypothetical protein
MRGEGPLSSAIRESDAIDKYDGRVGIYPHIAKQPRNSSRKRLRQAEKEPRAVCGAVLRVLQNLQEEK